MKTDPRLLFLSFLPIGLACSTQTEVEQAPALTASSAVVEPRPVDARPVARRDSGPRAEPARLKHDVDWLADDMREGRRAGTAKALESADYIATRFKALGLEAAGTQGFLQEFEVPLAPRDGGKSSVSWTGGTAGCLIAPGRVVPLDCSGSGSAMGKLVFCSYGIDDADRGRNDFESKDLKGAVALIVRGAPTTPPPKQPDSDAAANPHGDKATVSAGEGWGNGALIFTKVMNAKRRGAVAVILMPQKRDDAMIAFGSGGSARAEIPCVMVGWGEAAVLFGQWDLMFEFEGGEFDLNLADPKPMPGDGNWNMGGEVAVTADVHREKGPARNVLAKLRGTELGRYVVVGAHYDHLGKGGEGSLHPGEHGQIHNGADDNASGVAAVLEMARLMSTGPRPACDVVFALWSGEELGLLGSEYWAEHPTVPIASVTAALNLDMVGRANSGKLQILAAGTAEPFASWMADAGAQAGLELQVSTSGNVMGGSSDHATFIKRKIPALHLFSGLHADYHKPSDDADKFEADGAAKVTDLSVDLVRRMCEAGKLAFVEPKADPNEKQVRSGFRSWFGSIPNYAWEKKGILIDGASPGSPAEHAGFLKGDILLQIGDVNLDGMGDFMFALQTYKPGDVVLVKYQRDGQEQETRVTLSTRGQQ